MCGVLSPTSSHLDCLIDCTVSEVFRWEDVGPRARHAGGDGDGNDDCDVGGSDDGGPCYAGPENINT